MQLKANILQLNLRDNRYFTVTDHVSHHHHHNYQNIITRCVSSDKPFIISNNFSHFCLITISEIDCLKIKETSKFEYGLHIKNC